MYKLYITLYIFNFFMLYVHANLPILNSPVIEIIKVKMGLDCDNFSLLTIILKWNVLNGLYFCFSMNISLL